LSMNSSRRSAAPRGWRALVTRQCGPRVTVVTAGVLTLLAGVVPAASADPASAPATASRTKPVSSAAAGLSAADAELARVQQNLHKVATAVRATAAKAQASGFSGIILSPRTDEISVYWHGVVPDAISAAFTSAAVGQGATLHIRPSAYSKQELDSALARLDADSTLTARGLVSYGARPDGSGINIGVSGGLQLPDLGVRTFVDRTAKPAVPLFGRWDDSAPFLGGNVYTWETPSGDDGHCSSGFGVHEDKTGGFWLMLTAAHCYDSGLYLTPTDHNFGFYFNKVDEEDTMVIDTLGPHSTDRWIYTGDVDISGAGVGETRALVTGAGSTEVGDLLCTSGGFSGQRCGLQVTAVDITASGIRHVHELEQVAMRNAAGQGDSGGPVYAQLSQPPPPGVQAFVEARATITSGDPATEVDCTGFAPGRRCFWRIFVSDFPTALSRYNTVVNA
jgi:hypothetical protein